MPRSSRTLAVVAVAVAALASLVSAAEPDLRLLPTSLRDCPVLPSSLPGPPRHPPALQDPCDFVDCPVAPNACFEDSRCRFGTCESPRPKAFGTTCDDGDDSTVEDVCGGDGVCRGLALECPADAEFYDSESIVGDWEVPSPSYHGIPFVVRSNSFNPGDELPIGRHTITYTARGRTIGGRDVTLECRFTILVNNNCRGVSCPAPGPCQAEGVCVDGECEYDSAEDGQACENERGVAGSCISGACVDVCAFVDCRGSSGVCRVSDVCEPQGVEGVCVPGPSLPNGDYALANPPTFPAEWLQFNEIHDSATCRGGLDICASTYRHLPASPMAPPPHPPALEDPCTFVECPEPRNECLRSSQCAAGFCLEPQPQPIGFLCDDGDSRTEFDICGGNGACSGVRFTCPSDIEAYPVDDETPVTVDWNEPTPEYHGVAFKVTSNLAPGSRFDLGRHDIVYTATGVNPNGDTVTETCNFEIHVFDACQGIVCRSNNPCEEATCLGGQCVISDKDEGASCELSGGDLGACRSGTCEDLCRNVRCGEETGVCRGPSTCELDGLLPFCNDGAPLPDGDYPTSEPRDIPASFGRFTDPENIRCAAGTNICGGVHRHLPRLMLAPPPHPPEHTELEVTTVDIIEPTSNNVLVDICVGNATADSGETCSCDASCHACAFSNGFSGECFTCKDSLYLLDALCVSRETCVANAGVPTGSNVLGRRCNLDIESTTEASTTVDEFQCAGGRTDSGDGCDCVDLSNCNTCMVMSSFTSARCTICSNAKFLLNGVCIDRCPAGFEEKGSGNFRRRCEATGVTATTTTAVPVTATAEGVVCKSGRLPNNDKCACSKSCNTCNIQGSTSTCTICASARYLLGGVCIDACPAGFLERGSGNFRRRCEAIPGATTAAPITTAPSVGDEVPCSAGRTETNAPCSCSGMGECNTCEFSPSLGRATGCTICKNQQYLNPDNICRTTCPAGFELIGQGNFRRRCRAIPGFISAAPTTANPSATTTVPAGDVGECSAKKLPEGTPCTCSGISDCSICDFSRSLNAPLRCTVCGNSKFLVAAGTCEDTCPPNTEEKGSGTFRRRCEAVVARRALPGAAHHDAPADTRFAAGQAAPGHGPTASTQHLAALYSLGVFTVLSVLAAVGVAVHLSRRGSKAAAAESATLLPQMEEQTVPVVMDAPAVPDVGAGPEQC